MQVATQPSLAFSDARRALREAMQGGEGGDPAPEVVAALIWHIARSPESREGAMSIVGPEAGGREREVLYRVLAASGDPQALDEVRAVAASVDARTDERRRAIAALGTSPAPDPATVEALVHILDEGGELAGAAACSLGDLARDRLDAAAGVRVAESLGQRLGAGGDADRSVLTALGEIALPRSLPRILEALVQGDEMGRQAAVAALRRYPGEVPLMALMGALSGDPSAAVRAQAAQQIMGRAEPRATPRLADLVRCDPDPVVRCAALRALAAVMALDETARETVRSAVDHSPFEEIREEARRVMEAPR